MNIKLLFADDSITMQKVMELTLENEDVDLCVANDGEHALVAVASEKPDVVVADVSMPGLDGFELCKRIKESPDTGNIPVVLISGELEQYDEDRGRNVGADRHLTKPFKSGEFIVMLKDVAALPAEGLNRPLAAKEEPVVEPEVQDEAVDTTDDTVGGAILELIGSMEDDDENGDQSDDELEVIEEDLEIEDMSDDDIVEDDDTELSADDRIEDNDDGELVLKEITGGDEPDISASDDIAESAPDEPVEPADGDEELVLKEITGDDEPDISAFADDILESALDETAEPADEDEELVLKEITGDDEPDISASDDIAESALDQPAEPADEDEELVLKEITGGDESDISAFADDPQSVPDEPVEEAPFDRSEADTVSMASGGLDLASDEELESMASRFSTEPSEEPDADDEHVSILEHADPDIEKELDQVIGSLPDDPKPEGEPVILNESDFALPETQESVEEETPLETAADEETDTSLFDSEPPDGGIPEDVASTPAAVEAPEEGGVDDDTPLAFDAVDRSSDEWNTSPAAAERPVVKEPPREPLEDIASSTDREIDRAINELNAEVETEMSRSDYKGPNSEAKDEVALEEELEEGLLQIGDDEAEGSGPGNAGGVVSAPREPEKTESKSSDTMLDEVLNEITFDKPASDVPLSSRPAGRSKAGAEETKPSGRSIVPGVDEVFRRSIEQSVREYLENQGLRDFREILVNSIDRQVNKLLEVHMEQTLQKEITALLEKSFSSVMPKMINMVENITSQITPKIAEEMIKVAIEQITRGNRQ